MDFTVEGGGCQLAARFSAAHEQAMASVARL